MSKTDRLRAFSPSDLLITPSPGFKRPHGQKQEQGGEAQIVNEVFRIDYATAKSPKWQEPR